jgi:predicted transcriptional regulator
MDHSTLSSADVRKALALLTLSEIERLASVSGVPASTIYKIKRGETANPGIDTVGKFMPHLDALRTESA